MRGKAGLRLGGEIARGVRGGEGGGLGCGAGFGASRGGRRRGGSRRSVCRTALKSGQWLMALRSRGRAMLMATSGPRVARAGPHGEGDDAVGEQNAFVDIVGDEEYGGAFLLPDAFNFILQRGAGEGVEALEGFHPGGGPGSFMARARATARDAAWRMPPESSEGSLKRAGKRVDHADVVFHVPAALGAGPLGKNLIDSQKNVVKNAQPGEERIILEHQRAFRAGGGDGLALEEDLAGVWSLRRPARSDMRVVLPAPE